MSQRLSAPDRARMNTMSLPLGDQTGTPTEIAGRLKEI
jgi:hypothetical protein